MNLSKFIIIGTVVKKEERYNKENKLYWTLRVEADKNTYDIFTYDSKASAAVPGDPILVDGIIRSELKTKEDGKTYANVSLLGMYVKLEGKDGYS